MSQKFREMKLDDFIGKFYTEYNLNDTIAVTFEIKYAKEKIDLPKTFQDGSYFYGCRHITVSEEGHGWFGVHDDREISTSPPPKRIIYTKPTTATEKNYHHHRHHHRKEI